MASDPLPTPRAVLTSLVSSNLCLFLAAEWVGLKKLMGLSIRVKSSRDRERKGFGLQAKDLWQSSNTGEGGQHKLTTYIPKSPAKGLLPLSVL